MPSVYNYRHVELDNVGRGKRVIQPPGGQTADIFGPRADTSQAGSDVASSPVPTVETAPVDGLVEQPVLKADEIPQDNVVLAAANRSPKKTIPVVRRNPITGEIYDTPSDRQPVVRVRQPPGGRSSGIF